VELDGPSYFVAVADVDEASSVALRAAGAPVVSGLRVEGSVRAYMCRDDGEAPAGMRADPYWVVCGPDESGAVAGWQVSIDVSDAAVGPDDLEP
jgi:hypothetical protein